MDEVEMRVSAEVDQGLRQALRRLWSAAFDDFAATDEQHAYGGHHVLALHGGVVVGHASVVTGVRRA